MPVRYHHKKIKNLQNNSTQQRSYETSTNCER